ncbi:hypothetical protein FJZ17_03230 [Candidatus Pacearchaeota archaeon]|nr:hypothetical protein [Candidatus Pacearchaeota archaeon]
MEQGQYLKLREMFETALIEVMDLRGIPALQNNPEDSVINQAYLLTQLRKFKDAEKPEQDLHNLRVPLIYSRILKLLGIRNPEIAKSGQIAVIGHDFGKLDLLDLVDKLDFTPEDFERMKKHPEYSAEYLKKDALASRIALLSHYWQPPARKYPQKIPFKISPLERTLSIGLGIADYTDKAFNTRNNHLKRTPLEIEQDASLRQGYPSQERVLREVLRTYGPYRLIPCESDFSFNAPTFRGLIEQCFGTGIFDLCQKH